MPAEPRPGEYATTERCHVYCCKSRTAVQWDDVEKKWTCGMHWFTTNRPNDTAGKRFDTRA